MSLKNISVEKLLKLPEDKFKEYNDLLTFVKPKSKIGKYAAVQINTLAYGDVKMIQSQMGTIEGVVKAFELMFGIEESELFKIKTADFYYGIKYIKNEIERISQIEKSVFDSDDVDQKMKDAGIEKLEVFKELNTIIPIASKFGVTPMEVERWNYDLVFSIQYHEKVSNEIQKEYMRLTKPKT